MFQIKKITKIKGSKLHVKWKGYDNCFNSWTDKKSHSLDTIKYKSEYFLQPYEHSVALDLSNYAT